MPSKNVCFSQLFPLSSPVDRIEYIVNDVVNRLHGLKFAYGPLSSYNSVDIYHALKQNYKGKEHSLNASDASYGILDLFQYLYRHSHEVLSAEDVNAGLIKLLLRAGKVVRWMNGLEQHIIVQLVVAFSRARKEWKQEKAGFTAHKTAKAAAAIPGHSPAGGNEKNNSASNGHASRESGPIEHSQIHKVESFFPLVKDTENGSEKAPTPNAQGKKEHYFFHFSRLQEQLASKHIALFCDWMDENGVTESLEMLPQFPPDFW